MKKNNKSLPPNPLTTYYDSHKDDLWRDFRDFNAGDDYRKIQDLIFRDQGEICAYCEKELTSKHLDERRIEHYHSKSDSKNVANNLDLDWQNVIGVCKGGSYPKGIFPLPKNLSCDAHKEHLETKKNLNVPCDGYVLNPLEIIASPALFAFEKSTGELLPDPIACGQYTPKNNKFSNVEKLVGNTIEVFNLNCDRLKKNRLKVLYIYERLIKSAVKKNDVNIHSKIAESWFRKPWCSYFTTRRLILGDPAEDYLKSISYNG